MLSKFRFLFFSERKFEEMRWQKEQKQKGTKWNGTFMEQWHQWNLYGAMTPLWSNNLEVKVLNSQSKGPLFKTTV